MGVRLDHLRQLPSLSFDTADYPSCDRIGVWTELMSNTFGIDLVDFDDSGVFAKINAFDVGQACLGTYSYSPLIMRGSSKRSPLGAQELLVLGMHRAGSDSGLMGDVSFDMSPACLTLYDTNRAFEMNSSAIDYVSLMFPYSAIGYDPSVNQPFYHIELDTPRGLLLKTNFEFLIESVPNMSAAEAVHVINGFLDLLQTLFTQDMRALSSQSSFTTAREMTIRTYMKQNLRRLDLSADTICQDVGISRAVLYRLFSREGGVSKAIQEMRLRAAREELTSTVPQHGAVAQVAQKWAFEDAAHFSRRYRDLFNEKPSDALGSNLKNDPDRSDDGPQQKPRGHASFRLRPTELG